MNKQTNPPNDKPKKKPQEALVLRHPAKIRGGTMSKKSIEPDMDDLSRNRLWHLRQLIKTHGAGNTALILSTSDAYLTQIGGPNPTRRIGDKWAARIEKAFKLPPSAIDMDPPNESSSDDEYISQICATLAHASASDKELISAMAAWLVSRSAELPSDNLEIDINSKDVN